MLENMTQERWDRMTPAERKAARDLSDLSPQLVGLEGYRVSVLDMDGTERRFIVGRSTGWRPCHLELHNRRSRGGGPAAKSYKRVVPLYRAKHGLYE